MHIHKGLPIKYKGKCIFTKAGTQYYKEIAARSQIRRRIRSKTSPETCECSLRHSLLCCIHAEAAPAARELQGALHQHTRDCTTGLRQVS